MSEPEALVTLEGVRKEFGDVVAVKEVDFAVERGEFFSLVGPSGCGKTTTLRMISGFETPTAGEVTIDGASMTDVAPERRDTNLVFQHLSLFPHMSVRDNVAYGLRKAGIPESAADDGRSDAEIIDDLVEEHLELVDLGGFGDRNPTELSGGQQQRVALARALVNEPSVILLDEPLSSLDRKLRKEMQVELRRIHERTQGAFFYVTHDQEVAMTLSDRIAVMNDGRIEQVGPPEEIYRDPATPFVAGFIGDTNMLEASATPTADGCELTLADGVSIHADAAAEGEVRVSVRPEDFGIDAGGPIDGEVTERYFQGDQTNYVVVADADLPDLSVVVQGREDAIERGESVALGVSPDAPVVFQ